jgi:type II secretory pathway pseudopilin PulG
MERYIMNETTKVRRKLQFSRLLVTLSILSMLALSSQLTFAQQPDQQVFHSPEDAGAALFAAAQQTDNRALLEILGPAGKDLVSSGDSAEDRKNRDNFVAKYKQMHRVAREREGVMILYIGAENWPDPIPIIEKNDTWYFDTEAGKEEILARRVGRNELATIDVCYELVHAQQQHYARDTNGEHRYALTFAGDKDGQDGLFSSESQPVSPHDALIASAGVDNGAVPSHHPVPFNGYYFRILKSQGNNAEGGAKSYLVDGKMVSGFALVAYPAIYRSTGVTTFIVNQNGIVYQKDLGPDTEKIANAMTEYDPDSTWERVD